MSSIKCGALMGPMAETESEEVMRVSPGKVERSWKGVFALPRCIPTPLLEKW